MKISLGCDPECFLIDIQGQLHSSIGLIGGSKASPMRLELGEGYCVQEDNVALEFNIPPAHDRPAFIDSISKTLAYLTEGVQARYGFTLSKSSAESFPAEQLDNPAALEFGCEPDYNAWTKAVNPKPKAADATLRSCGGHVHVGYDKTKAEAETVIQMMDLFLGVPSILMDKGDLRKKLYGKAGAYRDKGYGVEYRTLSNFWIFNDKLIEWVWNNTSKAVDAAESQLTISEEDGIDIVSCINNNDKALAEVLLKRFNLEACYV